MCNYIFSLLIVVSLFIGSFLYKYSLMLSDSKIV